MQWSCKIILIENMLEGHWKTHVYLVKLKETEVEQDGVLLESVILSWNATIFLKNMVTQCMLPAMMRGPETKKRGIKT